jgi:signal transduction histidine kinase
VDGVGGDAIGDESLLRHALGNLLSNAVKYSPQDTPVELGARREGDDVVFVVRDRGIGMASEDRRHLFTAFRRGSNVGDRPGTGLGLVIARQCVDLHHGTLVVESTLGEGTTATVRLPLFDGAFTRKALPREGSAT